ncbi:MAG: nucleotidyltransferase substrate binding protein [Deltaproteobacteria bacterium]|nr:nucleotidyltransferase substrate binding protein [Deltaproteobacteria bacterium]
MSTITLTPLKKALASLEDAIRQPLDAYTRDSVVQRFEYTFELCWKTAKRFLEADRPLADDSVRGILREAHQRGFISDIDQWFSFHKSRNLVSHTYNEETAREVYADAVKLPKFCAELIRKLESIA